LLFGCIVLIKMFTQDNQQINNIMNDMIFKLNLPMLDECVLDNVHKDYLNNSNIPYHSGILNSSSIFKKEYQVINDIKFTNVIIWGRKDNYPGLSHTDSGDNTLKWAINWIHGGSGIMEYWDFDNVDGASKVCQEKSDYLVKLFETSKPANLVYFLTPGVYLVNTSAVHRATGFNSRYCVSLRSKNWMSKFKHLPLHQLSTIKWINVVDIFRDKIQDVDLLIGDDIKHGSNIYDWEFLRNIPKVKKLISLSEYC